MPLTGDGAAYGVPLQKVAEIALAKSNAAGGVEMEFIWEDGRCNGQDAASAVQKTFTSFAGTVTLMQNSMNFQIGQNTDHNTAVSFKSIRGSNNHITWLCFCNCPEQSKIIPWTTITGQGRAKKLTVLRQTFQKPDLVIQGASTVHGINQVPKWNPLNGGQGFQFECS